MNIKILSILAAGILSQGSAFAEGGMDAGGGDGYAAEFAGIGQQLAEILKTENVTTVNQEDFSAAVEQTLIVSEERVFLDGMERDAINIPSQNLIKLSRVRWDNLGEDAVKKYRLVLHEYLGIMRVSDQNYQVSSEILRNFVKPIVGIICKIKFDSGLLGHFTLSGTAYSNGPALVRGIIPAVLGAGKKDTRFAFMTYAQTSQPKVRRVSEVAFVSGESIFVISVRFKGQSVLRIIKGGNEKMLKGICKQSINGLSPIDK